MIVRTRDRKALEKQLEKDKDRVSSIGSEIFYVRSDISDLEKQIEDLESKVEALQEEQNSLEEDIEQAELKLTVILGKKEPTPAHKMARPKAEVVLTKFE